MSKQRSLIFLKHSRWLLRPFFPTLISNPFSQYRISIKAIQKFSPPHVEIRVLRRKRMHGYLMRVGISGGAWFMGYIHKVVRIVHGSYPQTNANSSIPIRKASNDTWSIHIIGYFDLWFILDVTWILRNLCTACQTVSPFDGFTLIHCLFKWLISFRVFQMVLRKFQTFEAIT